MSEQTLMQIGVWAGALMVQGATFGAIVMNYRRKIKDLEYECDDLRMSIKLVERERDNVLREIRQAKSELHGKTSSVIPSNLSSSSLSAVAFQRAKTSTVSHPTTIDNTTRHYTSSNDGSGSVFYISAPFDTDTSTASSFSGGGGSFDGGGSSSSWSSDSSSSSSSCDSGSDSGGGGCD